MGYTIEELIEIYADYNEIEYTEALEQYYEKRIDKLDLLDAFLGDAGIYGYTNILWHVFQTLK